MPRPADTVVGVPGDDETPTATLEPLFEHLNPEQRQAAAHLNGPLLVVAGPGSGKTRVLTHRVAALVTTGVQPWRILALTFTNKAADEMRERVNQLVGDTNDVWVSTFHSFCLRMLRRHHGAAGLPANFTVYDPGDVQRVLKPIVVAAGHDNDDAKTFASKISWAKNRNIDVADMSAMDGSWPEVARIYEQYRTHMQQLGAVDFDDLLSRTREMLAEAPDILEQLRNRFDRILVDEWQDTNSCQYDIVATLAHEHRQLCVVGDQQQAIYGWRGSTPEVLERFTEDFPEAAVVVLSENYRSTPEIVAVAQAVIDASTSRFRATLTTSNQPGSPVRCVTCGDGEQEARFIGGEIAAGDGTRAVIFRTNAQTRLLEQELARRRIPFQLVGTVRFYERAEVKDALAYLRVLVNPRDEIAVQRAASVPKRGLGDVGFAKLREACATRGVPVGVGLFDAELRDGLPGRARNAVHRLADNLEQIAAEADNGVEAAVRAVLDIGVRDYHRGEPERLENLEELVEAARSFDTDGSGTVVDVDTSTLSGFDKVGAFLEAVTLSSSTDTDTGAAVSLITAHASKGREFDHVWVAGAEDGLYPHSLSTDAAGVEEERRLFFVAVSRARTSLTITLRQRRFQWGDWQDAEPSPFLDDLPDSVVRKHVGGGPARSRTQHAGRHRAEATTSTTRRQRQAVWGIEPRRTVTPAGPRLDVADQQAGVRVVHPVFGAGTIETVTGSDVTIAFDDRVRVLDLSFAPLERIP